MSTASYSETSPDRSAYTETDPDTSAWARNSGIDTSVPTYSDSSISYSEATEFYNGYDATTITEDDVKFSTYLDSGIPANATWVDIT